MATGRSGFAMSSVSSSAVEPAAPRALATVPSPPPVESPALELEPEMIRSGVRVLTVDNRADTGGFSGYYACGRGREGRGAALSAAAAYVFGARTTSNCREPSVVHHHAAPTFRVRDCNSYGELRASLGGCRPEVGVDLEGTSDLQASGSGGGFRVTGSNRTWQRRMGSGEWQLDSVDALLTLSAWCRRAFLCCSLAVRAGRSRRRCAHGASGVPERGRGRVPARSLQQGARRHPR